jgi:hypothetical protein
MYVDKPLSGIKAVQTLSRLNRAYPQKYDCFVLDFQNNSDAITFAFQDYYRTTLLAEETDPNKLHDLKAALDVAQVYSPEQVRQVVELFLAGADRDKLDPILDTCVAVSSSWRTSHSSASSAIWCMRSRTSDERALLSPACRGKVQQRQQCTKHSGNTSNPYTVPSSVLSRWSQLASETCGFRYRARAFIFLARMTDIFTQAEQGTFGIA